MAEIETVGIVGAGQMGSGIAQTCASAGYQVVLWDISSEASQHAVAGIGKRLDRLVEKEKISADECSAAKTRIRAVGALDDFSDCDLVIEAVTENLAVKTELFEKLDAILAPHSYLVSNTSSISITKIASATKRPEQVMGVHFMNPVPVMKLVELIRGLQTSDASYQAMEQFVTSIGKTSILAKDTPGFIVNRVLVPMINEAIFLVQEGVKPEDVDQGMVLGTNQPMGPLTLADFVGLDTCLYILQVLHRELGEDKYRPCPLLIKYVEAGWHGRKTGRGFYEYGD